MRLVAAPATEQPSETHIETVALSPAQMEFLGRLSRDINPAMPLAFGGAHVVRTLLERLEEAGLDLSAAGSEHDVAEIATTALRHRRRARR